jgi:tRNA(Arg) A34 adenosine deaminase TadA
LMTRHVAAPSCPMCSGRLLLRGGRAWALGALATATAHGSVGRGSPLDA